MLVRLMGASRSVVLLVCSRLLLLTHVTPNVHAIGLTEAYTSRPKEIYYFAKLKEQKDYHEKYFQKEGDDFVGGGVGPGPREQALKDSSNSSVPVTYSAIKRENRVAASQEEYPLLHGADQLNLRQDLKQELKRELQQSQDQILVRLKDQLQDQLQAQQRGFDRQMADMKEMLAAALAAKS